MDISKLQKTIKECIPLVVKEWNDVKLKEFNKLFEKSFFEYFNNRQTQEKTKIVSPIIDVLFSRIMSEKLPDFIIDEGNGKDYRYGDLELEKKLTLSVGNSWTGNGYNKVGYHILSKFDMNDYGHITSYFSCLVNLDECLSGWSKPKNSNFSSLKFLNGDISKITPIHGSVNESTKYLAFKLVGV